MMWDMVLKMVGSQKNGSYLYEQDIDIALKNVTIWYGLVWSDTFKETMKYKLEISNECITTEKYGQI